MKKNAKYIICLLIALITVFTAAGIAGVSGTVEAETNITKIQTYVSPPMPGQKLDFDPEIPASETGYAIDGVRWLDGAGKICSPGTVAELGKTYTVEIYVCTNSGYVFTPHGVFNGYINQEEIPAYRILGYAGDESRFLCLYADMKCENPVVTIKNDGDTGAVETRGYTYYGGDSNYYHTLNAKSGASGSIFKLWRVINSDSGKTLYELDTPYYKYSSGTPANITFEAVYESGKTISTIKASGVTEPIIWLSPKYTAQVDPNVGYEIWTDCPVEYVKNGVRWYDATAKYYLDPDDVEYTFLAGRKYFVEVFVKAKDGYNFANLAGKICTLNGFTGNISKTVSGYSPLLYQSVGITYESKDITLEIHGPDGLVSSSLHAAGSIADITAPFADGKVFTGWVITSGRGRIDDASAFKTRFWLPGDGTATVRLKALYKDAAEELRPILDDTLIDDVSVGINPAPQNLIAGQEYDLRFKWSMPLKYYNAGYRLLAKLYIPDYGWLKLTVLPTKDSDSAHFTVHDTITGSAGSRPIYRLSLTLVDPEKRNSTSVLELNSITLQFHNIVIDKQPQDVTVANGQTAKTTVTARGNGLTYQWWFYDKALGKFVKSSDKDSTYNITMSPAIDGTKVYCVITDSKGNTATTKTVTLSMTAVPTTTKSTTKPTTATTKSTTSTTKSTTKPTTATTKSTTSTTKSTTKPTTATTKPTTTKSTTKSTTATTKPTATKSTTKSTTATTKPTTTKSTTKSTTVTTKPTTTKSTTKSTTVTTKPTTTKSTTKSTTATTKPTTTKSTTKSTTVTTKPTTTKSTTKSTTATTKPITTKSTTVTTKSTTKPTTATTTPTQPSTNIEVIRLSGKGRCQTAVKISNEAFTKADNVVLASGDNYADALAGVPLAYKMNAPILLVQKHMLHADTLAEIQRLGAKNVYILGGAAAISDDVKTELEGKGYHVERIKGKNRFATSLEIAKKLQELCGKPDEIFFAYSHNYPDALAVSGVAAAKGCPVVYVAKSGILDKDIAEFVKNSGAKKGTIIGGTAAIGEAAEGDIAKYCVKNVTRLSGKNRYATCVKINEAYADVLTGKSVCVATGTNFPDALAGGVFAAKTKSPLVLVGTSLANEHKSYLGSKDANKVYVFGGTGAVSENVASSIVEELKK